MAQILRDYDLIIFDCDGVLVDSEMLSCRCLLDLLRQCGIKTDLDTILDQFLGRSVDSVIEHYRASGYLLPKKFPTALRALVRQSFATALQPIPDVATLVRGLTVAHCVASSSDLDRVEFSLDLSGLSAWFAGRIYTAQMVARGKPEPDLFLHAAAMMKADPARTLVVEDSVSGVRAGKAAGMTVWGFVGGSHYASRDGHAMLSAAGADRIFARMADFFDERANVSDAIIRERQIAP